MNLPNYVAEKITKLLEEAQLTELQHARVSLSKAYKASPTSLSKLIPISKTFNAS